MKKIYLLAVICLLTTAVSFSQPSYYKTEPKWTEKDFEYKYYTVRGERHGLSFFKKYQFKEVEYKAGEKLTFDLYHTPDVKYAWYRKWAEKYPEITDLYEVAKSFEGRPILQMTITNKKTGKHTEKPAAYFEGGRHSGEVTGKRFYLQLKSGDSHLKPRKKDDAEIFRRCYGVRLAGIHASDS